MPVPLTRNDRESARRMAVGARADATAVVRLASHTDDDVVTFELASACAALHEAARRLEVAVDLAGGVDTLPE